MSTLLSILLYLGITAGVMALWGFLVGRFLQVDREPDSVIFFSTEDGWRLALTHLSPIRPLVGAPPVLLCPGFGLSSAIFDLLDQVSLARYLAAQGHDVWLLDPRGRGFSERPRLWGRRRVRWSFDDYVDFDVPAAIEEVCRRTGEEKVQWIGLGLGALALFAAWTGLPEGRICSITALAAPVFFKRQGPLLGAWSARILRLVWSAAGIRLIAPLLGRLTPWPFSWMQNMDNVDGPVYRRAMVNSVCRPAPQEVEQYVQWLAGDLLEAHMQRRDYRSGLASINVPVLLLGGPRDALAPIQALESTLAAIGDGDEQEKVLLLASRMHGMSANYGHLDLLLGRNARRDTFPHLLSWLDLHSGVEISEDRSGGRPLDDPSARPAPRGTGLVRGSSIAGADLVPGAGAVAEKDAAAGGVDTFDQDDLGLDDLGDEDD